MKLAVIICAKDITIDRSSNMTSIFNVYDDSNVPSFPAFLAPFSVFTVFEKKKREADNQKFNLLIQIANQKLLSQEILLEFQGRERVRNIIQFAGLPLTGPGLFEVLVSKNKDLLGRYWFYVNQLGPIESTSKKEMSQLTDGVLVPRQLDQQPNKKWKKVKKVKRT